MSAYLLTHFTGEQRDGEQVYFSVSRDGLHWHDIGGGKPVLRSRIGTGGVRDPFPVRHPLTGRFYIIATDLRVEAGVTWLQSKTEGSRDIIIWESGDLINWDGPRAVTVGIPEAGNVWAPEAIFDEERGMFLVYFASNVRRAGDSERRQRIYGAFTEDFRTFSDTFLYMEKAESVIDTTIIRDGGRYFRVTKSEVTKTLTLEFSESLYSGFKRVPCPAVDDYFGLEGPEAYRLPDGRWCLIADRFAADEGYLPMVTDDFATGELRVLSPWEYDFDRAKKRHGGVMEIEDSEYERLMKA